MGILLSMYRENFEKDVVPEVKKLDDMDSTGGKDQTNMQGHIIPIQLLR